MASPVLQEASAKFLTDAQDFTAEMPEMPL